MNRESSSSSISLNSNHEEDRDQSTITEEVQFWHEDPIEENLDPNFGRGQDGEPNEEGPPPYEQAEAQANQGPNELYQLIHGLIQAQQNQHQAQVENSINFQQAHTALGNEIRHLAMIVEQLSQRGHYGGRPQLGAENITFKPSMFRPLDMKAVNKENKLLSEEYMNWMMNIYRVLRANPAAANLPIQRLTALILAGIGEKAEKRLTGLGQNPTFNSLEEFFEKLKAIFCSSTCQTDAETQFSKAKQRPEEDINSWHARCRLYYKLAFPHQDHWSNLLRKYFQGMSSRKLADQTLNKIGNTPEGFQGLCNEAGYEACLKLTLECQAFVGFKAHLFYEKDSSYRSERAETSVPMDTSSVQNRTPYRGQRIVRNTTGNVNSQNKGPREPRFSPNSGPNPPAGAQKKLQQQARANRSQSQPLDKSKDRCLKCNNVGHWARDCPERSKGSVNSTQMTVVPEKHSWSDANIISSVSNTSKSSHSTELYDYSRANKLWQNSSFPKLTDAYPKYLQLRPQSKL